MDTNTQLEEIPNETSDYSNVDSDDSVNDEDNTGELNGCSMHAQPTGEAY